MQQNFSRTRGSVQCWIDDKTTRVDGLLVLFERGKSRSIYDNASWRTFAAENNLGLIHVSNYGVQRRGPEDGGDKLVLAAIGDCAHSTGHKELTTAPIIWWGHSRSVYWAVQMSARYPQRTLGFVSYHMMNFAAQPEDRAGLPMKKGHKFLDADSVQTLATIPGLVLGGQKDFTIPAQTQNQIGVYQQLAQGRALGAPWTGGIQPGKAHGDGRGGEMVNTPIMKDWIQAILPLRLPKKPGQPLQAIDVSKGWLGHLGTAHHETRQPAAITSDFAIAPISKTALQNKPTSWLPNETFAKQWAAYFSQGL